LLQILSDYSLFINCGGRSVVIDGNVYEDDSSQIGTSTFVLSDDKRWAYSSTGDFVGNENADYIARNKSRLALAHPELYTEARLSPLSLKYYGLCMENGEYLVNLHFAEIMFTDDHTYSSNGKRVFEVLIQVQICSVMCPLVFTIIIAGILILVLQLFIVHCSS
jgi:hypothetical protein